MGFLLLLCVMGTASCTLAAAKLLGKIPGVPKAASIGLSIMLSGVFACSWLAGFLRSLTPMP
ncbi:MULTISPECIES: hypothetical protein [unclassified Paenibacillus]|uniref:hypothetical protein n=1 Tax=unclassified Paenibacillus TaxID=185978 RepID=UPI000956422E|nr:MULTISPECIES: hypothetical protein [unclassified Paenibacillus]ASS68329.1 hypothetical protein CIC07_20985 [Paenibacillus sp. RUD330]SIR29240.1 hypothetical protein SAMN05880555_3383 [Paenibacillus sp. RU4X]SIR41290.1 hypothetical protein SAMN05880570_3384 [Paenibacillus sp. RU4T]